MPSNVNAILIERMARYGPIPEPARAALSAIPMTLREFESGSYIVREADAPVVCAVLVSGFAYRQKVTRQGARQIVAICIPGDIVDLQNLYLDQADHSVQMLTDGALLVFHREELQNIADEHPSVARALLIDALIDGSILREWVTNIGQRNALTRTAHLLCEFAVRVCATPTVGAVEYELPMNQEQLGDALGLTAVHVNRMLRQLNDEGLVIWSKKTVRLPDWMKIRAAGDFNSRYLHLDQLSNGR